MELYVTMSDVNLGKLVPLEVHGMVKNAKIAKKYFPMLERSVFYTVGKLKRRDFQQAKEHANWKLGEGDTAPENPGTRNWKFPGVSWSDPTTPKRGGFLQRAAKAYVWGNVSEWRREAVTSSP